MSRWIYSQCVTTNRGFVPDRLVFLLWAQNVKLMGKCELRKTQQIMLQFDWTMQWWTNCAKGGGNTEGAYRTQTLKLPEPSIGSKKSKSATKNHHQKHQSMTDATVWFNEIVDPLPLKFKRNVKLTDSLGMKCGEGTPTYIAHLNEFNTVCCIFYKKQIILNCSNGSRFWE